MSFVLDERTASFIAGPTASIAVASRDTDNVPSLFKAVACRVGAEGRRVTLFVDQQLASRLVRDLRAGGPIAAVFSEPATHRTLQLKGDRAEIGAVTPADREYCREQYESIVAHIVALDYRVEGVRCYFHFAPEHLVALTFVPTAGFEQTPGPGAGNRLKQ